MVWAALVTFNRPREFGAYLDALRRQSLSLKCLVVVNNGDEVSDDAIAAHREAGFAITVLSPGQNLGPAGGWNAGVDDVLRSAADDDWVFLLDDDDPPRLPTSMERVAALAQQAYERDQTVGAAGLVGARFDRHRGRVVRLLDSELGGVHDVNVIGGNLLGLYRVGALRACGGLREDLFFGFEELELGLRLGDAGYRMVVDGALMLAEREHAGTVGQPAVRRSGPDHLSPWRRYYSVRNMILITRSRRLTKAALRVTLSSGLIGPISLAFKRPSLAPSVIKMAFRGVLDGWRGRTGITVAPVRANESQRNRA